MLVIVGSPVLAERKGGIPSKMDVPTVPTAKIDKDRQDRTKQKKPRVSDAVMYKHMVRAIYHSLKGREARDRAAGYIKRRPVTKYGRKISGSSEIGAQKIARSVLVKYGYAGRRKRQGGVRDRTMISLTGKGKQRNLKHRREPKDQKDRKSAEYWQIVGTDPLRRL
jgi:hypothetical protein